MEETSELLGAAEKAKVRVETTVGMLVGGVGHLLLTLWLPTL